MKSAAMDAFVAQVKEASDILGVVSSYVALKRKGNRYWGCCPFHQEKTASFSVVPNEGFFYCFGCHAGGNVFKFLSLIENVSYFEAIKLQAEKLGIPIPSQEKSKQELAQEQKIADLRKVLTMARDFFHSCLVNTSYGKPGLAYFRNRGISDETIQEFQLGFAPDSFDKLLETFRRRGVPEHLLRESGLVGEREGSGRVYDRFRNRVMIPIADVRGNVVGFGGRILGSDTSAPKYLNSPETTVFNKRRLLFGLHKAHRAIARAGYAILMEGYMDAISTYSAGVQNVIASLGTSFTIEQCRLLLRYASEIYFCYDSDDAGQNATMRALSIIRETGARARVLIVPDGKDPDEFIRNHGIEAFRDLLQHAMPLTEYQMQYALRKHDTRTMEGKARFLQAVMPMLQTCGAVERSGYISRMSRTLGIEEGLIRQELLHQQPEQTTSKRAAAPARPFVRRVDSAVERAGRSMIRFLWTHPERLASFSQMLPLAKYPYALHREILQYMADEHTNGRALSDTNALATLTATVADELSHALVEMESDADSGKTYADCLRVLRKAYLETIYEEHRLMADTLQREGKDFLQELAESHRIRKEMDQL